MVNHRATEILFRPYNYVLKLISEKYIIITMNFNQLLLKPWAYNALHSPLHL